MDFFLSPVMKFIFISLLEVVVVGGKTFCFIIFLMLYEFSSHNLVRLCVTTTPNELSEKIINSAITLNFLVVRCVCDMYVREE